MGFGVSSSKIQPRSPKDARHGFAPAVKPVLHPTDAKPAEISLPGRVFGVCIDASSRPWEALWVWLTSTQPDRTVPALVPLCQPWGLSHSPWDAVRPW